MTSCHSSTDIRRSVRSRFTPALLTRISIWPNSSTVFATIACTSFGSPTPARIAIALPPLPVISATSASAGSWLWK